MRLRVVARPTAAIAFALLLSAPLHAQAPQALHGFAEWVTANRLIVDGEEVRIDSRSVLRVPAGRSLRGGDQVDIAAVRLADGAMWASTVEARAAHSRLFESDLISASDSQELSWRQAGLVTLPGGATAAVTSSGRDVDRLRRILRRITPLHLASRPPRVYLLETDDWNAMAMPNGSIWVFRGLLTRFDDDELAVILGHELAHVTYEHSVRRFQRSLWGAVVNAGLRAATAKVESQTLRKVSSLAAGVATTAWVNGYSRDQEDQADRVGLRYAAEGGFSVTKAPEIWRAFEAKYGPGNRVANFLFGGHSLASARAMNLERQIALAYRATPRLTTASGAAEAGRRASAGESSVPGASGATTTAARSLPPAAAESRAVRSVTLLPGMTYDAVRELMGMYRESVVLSQQTKWVFSNCVVTFSRGRVIDVTFE